MGRERLVDKTIRPEDVVRALQAGTVTIAQAQQMFNGILPVGNYRGVAALLDLDLLVKQPLVQAEQLHILGLLDGREEDYDLQTVRIPNGAVANASVREQLAVPTNEVWYITAIELITPPDQGGTPAINWRCSLWADRAATPDADGQAFHAANLANSPLGGTWYDEFHAMAPAIAVGNKPVALRLPGGTVITAVATNLTAVATANMDCTLRLHGFIGKLLVD